MIFTVRKYDGHNRDWSLEGIFSSREKADQYIADHPLFDEWFSYEIEQRVVDFPEVCLPLACIEGTKRNKSA